MRRRVLLTGATGFVGRQVLRQLREFGMAVRVVVRPGALPRVPDLQSMASSAVVQTEDAFSQDEAWWRECCEGIDTVFHAAWYAEPGKYLESPRNLDCLQGTIRLARGAAEAGVRRFVGIGTCFEYDLSRGSPAGHFSTTSPLSPVTLYAACKASAYLTLGQWFKIKKIEFLWCRLFYLYGEGEDSRRLVPYLRACLSAGKPADLTSGAQIRDFLDVDVAARRMIDAALSEAQGAINICSGQGITVRELALQIADEYGRRDLLNFGARPDNLVDPPCVVGLREQT